MMIYDIGERVVPETMPEICLVLHRKMRGGKWFYTIATTGKNAAIMAIDIAHDKLEKYDPAIHGITRDMLWADPGLVTRLADRAEHYERALAAGGNTPWLAPPAKSDVSADFATLKADMAEIKAAIERRPTGWQLFWIGTIALFALSAAMEIAGGWS